DAGHRTGGEEARDAGGPVRAHGGRVRPDSRPPFHRGAALEEQLGMGDPPVRENDRVARDRRLASATSSAEADRTDVLAPTGPEEQRTRVQQDAAVARGPNDLGTDLSRGDDRGDRVPARRKNFRGTAAPAP